MNSTLVEALIAERWTTQTPPHPRRGRVRAGLDVADAGGLAVDSFYRVVNVDPGFRTEGVLTFPHKYR